MKDTLLSIATYDVQNPEAGESEDGIMVTGEFITDSRARGCFIVIISYDNTADVFRALQREDSSVTYIEDIINVPPSTYTVYAYYDLEENALPNPFPANTTSSGPITITTPCKKHVLVNTVVTYLIVIHITTQIMRQKELPA